MNQLTAIVDGWRKKRGELLCGLILAVMGVNLFSQAARKSLTNDELVHIPSAHRHLIAGDFRLNPEHPPLAKLWAALPLPFVHLRYMQPPPRTDQDFLQFTSTYSSEFWQLNKDSCRAIAFWSRLPMVILTLGLGVLIFIYARTFFTLRAAVIAVAIFSLEPTMLGHGWIVHTDIPAAYAYLLFFFGLQRYWVQPTFRRAIWFGLFAGIALVTKFSLAVVAAVFLVVLIYGAVQARPLEPSKLKRLARVGFATITAFVLVNAAYFFQHPRLAPQDSNWISIYAGSPLAAQKAIGLLNIFSRVVPTYYLFGIYTVYVHNRLGHPSSLLGSYSLHGWWSYFPVTFALKTSIPVLILSVVAILWAMWSTVSKRKLIWLPALLAIALFLGMSIFSHINIGVRHIIPIFPFLFLLAGAFLDRLLKTRYLRAAIIAMVVLFGWMGFDAVAGYRNYISFTNSLTLGRPNWQVLSDSNVEWGEEIGELAEYLHQQGDTRIMAAMSASMTPHLEGLEIVGYAPRDLQSSPTRYVAIGASYLNGSTVRDDLTDENGVRLTEEQRVNYFANYRTLKPERVFGNSIYLYRKPDR
jgi:dolichyl-phosphate-mannose-protein mannosyltransferase